MRASAEQHTIRLRDSDGSDDPMPTRANGELEAFARWFADWWLRRGRDLTDPEQSGPDDLTEEPIGGRGIEPQTRDPSKDGGLQGK
jgi:hypothetical protein